MDIFTGQGKRLRANVIEMDIHPPGLPESNRVVFNHLDVSTQANIQHSNALTYESDDEMLNRTNRCSTPHYNRADIKEQYCITERGLGALETKQSLFGCLSVHQGSCSTSTSLLTACVRQKVPSDENLYDLYKRHPSEYAPYPRRNKYPWGPVVSDIYRYDEDLKSSYFRRKPIIDPSRYTWMPSDDESIRMEKPKSIMENGHDRVSNSSSGTLPGKKHVSFARSHTLASFDNAISTLSCSTGHLNKITNSQERLLDVRKPELQPIITKQPEQEIYCDKIKRVPMKTQATQTEAGLGRKPIPPHINLSPRTMQKVKMVSQGAQTNGLANNGRKLIKSYSEAGSKFGISPINGEVHHFESIPDHDPLQRTQSDEPPRSPFVVEKPSTFAAPERTIPTIDSETSSLTKSDHESEDSTECKKEIMIDFKPHLSPTKEKSSKRTLMKALSDGEILLEQRRVRISDDCVVPEKPLHSLSHEYVYNNEEEDRTFSPHFQTTPIQNEDAFKLLDDNPYPSLGNRIYEQESIEEDFHENLIYNKSYLNDHEYNGEQHINMENWLKDDSIVPSISFLPHAKLSPFTSNDSLANDTRDQSDGIWNESQATVLQVDSGTENGTVLSSSEFNSATSPIALTPSSKRKHLLMLQHQQRSSMDTEILDEETVDQNVALSRKISVLKNAENPVTSHQRQYLFVENAVSTRKKLTPETPVGSPLPAIVPNLVLSRTDSCRTNTDISESTTTDDYITANSGTDSSRKSGSVKGNGLYNNLQPAYLTDGSSLDSARGVELLGDDMVVPRFSPSPPPPVPSTGDSSHSLCNTPVPHTRTGRSTPSEESSSSCGSYSVGSTPDLLDRFTETVPSRNKKVCSHNASDDERSVRYSSSGYYESPMEDDTTWTSPKNKARRCKDLTLDLSNNPKSYLETYSILSSKSNKRNIKASPSGEKSKRSKSRMKSPMQGSRKSTQLKKQAHIVEKENKATSDESSCDLGVKHLSNQSSPRRGKKIKENNKKKGLPRSPVNQRTNADKKASSLPGSLSRKKSSKQSQSNTLISENDKNPKKSSSLTRHGSKVVEDSTKLKALSAESLRSVSPGSDSVFYSDPSSQTVDHQIHCLHCGKEVDIVTTDDPDKSISSLENPEEIVQPPAGFEDSPRIKTSGRLFKKLERRIRSEERNYLENKKNRYKSDVRAKSEERGNNLKNKLRPMAKSTNNSQEQLKAADSSPSVLPGAPENEDDVGIYDVSYKEGCWIHIDEREEVIARTSCSSPSDKPSSRRDSISSTESEQEFRKRFQAVTHRMVHRKSCLEMYKRQTKKTFDCDKKVVVHRESGEFGFRIHGSKPVVVSAIEPGTPAETCGLEVGDIVLSVNGVSVLDKNHSEIVKMAHAGSDTLKMEVARTCYALCPQKEEDNSTILHSGYLWKLSGYASGTSTNKWMRRWFCLKQNGCLYCYKTDVDVHPVDVTMLHDQVIQIVDDEENFSKSHVFVVQKQDGVPLYLAAESRCTQEKWVEEMNKLMIDNKQLLDGYLERTKSNLSLPPGAIKDPECFGYLVKLGTQWKSWSRRYCILKEACLYFYQDANAKNAFGVAYLHGYRVQLYLSGSKKHAFELVPSDSSKKHYYFHTDSETDKKRWIAALEYSIDQWMKL
ncbi:uncharacterized protein LOC130440701 isoform X2 [Diorhabda sublineata]|uniref:uncharacterized protein LOC130440701 isoform X2 n=1 Tax=Diorhabda sublineata TaxID=1163346 RepID=UPI0024E152F7|nr:uncharacterized protein LOC130440701 isoform X2 [Diorhabda sublineata]